MHPVAFFMTIAALAVAIVLIFVQRRLSRKANPIIGLIIPVVYFLLSMIVGLILTGGAPFWQYLRWFLIANIPTVVYLLIYFVIRFKLKQNNDLDKMKAQDLE
jgi:NADH:ubiquinone oxidoreductase subunit 5 (subunit L)/multisubunit Na+/H+ antiporter MnhA subunit